MNALLRVDQLCKTYQDADGPVVRDAHFAVGAGEIFVIVGPSGCGKTTLLRCIAGFECPDSGTIEFDNRIMCGTNICTPPEKRGIGLVFQDYALFPHLTVLENVMFGIRGVPRARRRAIATEILWTVGLADYVDRKPHDLSGGQQQRVALGRALAPWPKLILLDEPFSNLDPELRQTTRDEIRSLMKRTGKSAVLVTHDQTEALSVADRIAVMHSGRIIQIGKPEAVYQHPKTSFVARFLGRTNLIEANATVRVGKTSIGPIELDRDAQGPVLLSIRPEHLHMCPVPDATDASEHVGEIIAREFKGHDMTYKVRVGIEEIAVQTDYRADYPLGQKVTLHLHEPAAVVDRHLEE